MDKPIMRRASLWLQTKTLIKRNFIVKLRVKQSSIQEVLMPIYFVVLLALLKSFAYKPTAYPSLASANLTTTQINDPLLQKTLYVAPNISDATRLMETVQNLSTQMTYEIFNSQAEMDTAYTNLSKTEQGNVVGLLFVGSSVNQYALRFPNGWFTGSFTNFNQGSCRQYIGGLPRPYTCPADQFRALNFTAIQSTIDNAIAKMIDPNFDAMSISARIMPKDATIANTEAFDIIGPLYLVMALGPFLTFLLVFLVYEKEKKIKEGMKMMGLDDLAYWISWGIIYAASLLVMTLVMTLIGYFGGLWGLSNFFLVFLFMFIYGLSIQMLGYMLTPFFNKARTAGAVGGFLTIILSLMFLLIQLVDVSDSVIWAASLLSPTAFAFVMSKVFYFEVTGAGAHFYNLTEGPNPMYIGLVMMVVDIFLYFLLTLYLDNVVPSEYGRKRSVSYCLKPSYWCRGRRGHGITRDRASRHSVGTPGPYSKNDFEPVPSELIGNEAITFQGIRKVFPQKSGIGGSSEEVVAIQGFTLDIYKGQITALLGHNGAGKTTLFNILTGFVASTSGRATVYGYDVSDRDDMDEIRKITGVCPQHDILIDYLSVIEHLETFAGLKGYEGEEKDAEVERVLSVIGLVDQRDTFAKKLSGGQKRKLSVGIAILGDPKILILDEPTAGMDPYSRRKLWDLLRSNQEDRVTLLTTHFMDEADILADRKAILTKGKLRCVGSSLFLKNRFGVGYHLGVVSKNHEDERAITTCVAEHIQDSELHRSVGLEHAYTLPMNQISNFPVLFSDLDKRQEELSIQSYGVSMTSLEEVFLKIGEEDEAEEEQEEAQNGVTGTYRSIGYSNPIQHDAGGHDDDSRVAINIQNGALPTFDPEHSEATKERKSLEQVLQLVRRTLLINLRSPGYVIFAIILPIVMEILGTFLYTTSGSSNSSSSKEPVLMDMTYQNNLASYGDQTVLYKGLSGTANASFISNIPDGVVMQPSSMTDSDLLQSGFYPHSVGLDMSVFNLTQAAYLALYNTSYTRSLPSAINLVSNALTSFLNGSAPTNIVTYSKDWPQTESANSAFDIGAFSAALLISMAILIPTALAAGNPVRERELKIRTQLRVSGVRFLNYWGAFLLGDYVIFLIMAVVYVICIFAFQITGLNNGGAIGALILLLIGWGISCLLTSYCASFMFSRYETAQAAWPALVPITGLLPYIVVSTLDLTGSSDAAMYINIPLVILIPYYTGFSGVYFCFKIYINYLIRGEANNIPASAYFDWSEPMVPFSVLMAWVHVVVFFLILVVADVKKHGGELPTCGGNQVGSTHWQSDARNDDVDEIEDEDVTQERVKVAQLGQQGQIAGGPVVLMEGLRKEFAKRTSKSCQSCRKQSDDDEHVETLKVAVRNFSMTVYPGEVVGLLGPNGAGKTTALNVLIADIGATKGKVSIGGEVITSSLSEAFKSMGYCPQSNPLWDQITLKEHLEIYATIRGVPKDKIPSTVSNFMAALDIDEHKNKRAKALSGGTKRKLCFAISMLGNPQVVLLDEPSTGMDPKTKRFLWNTISTSFEGTDRGAILTTHYMEEADALCSRVGIMVRGQLRCLGSTQHLKGKFGQGYILEIKLDHQLPDHEDGEGGEYVEVHRSDLENFVKELFPSVEEPEKFGNRLTFKIKREDVTSLGKVFSSLEEAKSRLGIEEYSFSQSTLEQVFLRFAKEQAEKDEHEQQQVEERKRAKKMK